MFSCPGQALVRARARARSRHERVARAGQEAEGLPPPRPPPRAARARRGLLSGRPPTVAARIETGRSEMLKECLHCGVEFEGPPQARFHSDACRKAYARTRTEPGLGQPGHTNSDMPIGVDRYVYPALGPRAK